MAFSNKIQQQFNPPFTLQTEQELNFAKFLVNHVADAVFWLGSDGQFLYVNKTVCRLLGYSCEELLSLTIHEVNADLSTAEWSKQWRSLVQQGSLTIDAECRTKKGRMISVQIAYTYVKYQSSEFSCTFVRPEQTTEVKLRQALKQEKKRSQLRAHYVYMLSHEVRTPLNIVSFSTSLLRRHLHKWTEEKKRLHLDRIISTIEQIGQLLDTILLIGKTEAGKLKFEPKPLNLYLFCYELVAQMQLLSNSSQHVITFDSLGDCSMVRADKKLLQLILTNLLNNAIKYSPSGSTIDFLLSEQNEYVVFQIKDAGIGIPAAEQKRLFEPFHRGSNISDIPGSGLGLAIVKKLVDLHSGQITVVSKVGVGTTFTVTLPLVK